jgi:hypothetical protein
MARVYFHAFVCDEDSGHLEACISGYPVVPLSKIGITKGRGTEDPPVVRHARDSGCIVITANKSHFATEMRRAANRCEPADCVCGGGMITVPNGMPKFQFRKITKAMRLGTEPITWSDVFTCNLHVSVQRNDSFTVRRLPVCEYFLRDHADCDDCIRLGIRAA